MFILLFPLTFLHFLPNIFTSRRVLTAPVVGHWVALFRCLPLGFAVSAEQLASVEPPVVSGQREQLLYILVVFRLGFDKAEN